MAGSGDAVADLRCDGQGPATFIGIPLILLAATAVAILVPARRAMSIDPIVALRYE
jgi:ABC-type antimicrobial peptide transport system permease subunit